MAQLVMLAVRKKRGPPATGKGAPILVRIQPPLARLNVWIAKQDARLTRPEAIRRLIEIALAPKAKRSSR